jgi:hypothetical protein
VVVLVRHLLAVEIEAGRRRHVERVAADDLDALVERRREAGEVHHEIGVLQPGGVLPRELQVVRFGAGRREVGDGDAVAADPLGDELERVEGRDHVEPGLAHVGSRGHGRTGRGVRLLVGPAGGQHHAGGAERHRAAHPADAGGRRAHRVAGRHPGERYQERFLSSAGGGEQGAVADVPTITVLDYSHSHA